MNLKHPTIAVIGAGAVGGYYGARLAQHGNDVHFLMRGDFHTVRAQGLQIRSVDGDFFLPPEKIQIYQSPADMPKADLVLITLKTTANRFFEPLVSPLITSGTAILTLQNGLGNEARLAELFGADRIMGGMAFVCINRVSPGVLHHTDHGLIKIGEFQGGRSPRVEAIASLFQSSGIKCEVLNDLNVGRWEKLIWNIPFNGLGAVLDLTTDTLISNRDNLKRVTNLMKEILAVSASEGVAFDENIITEKIKHTQTMGAYKTSMQIDRQMRRPMEIEAIMGEAVHAARRNSVATPYLESLYSSLKSLEIAL